MNWEYHHFRKHPFCPVEFWFPKGKNIYQKMLAHTWPRPLLTWAIFFPIWISCTCAGRMFDILVHSGKLRWNPAKRRFGRWVSFLIGVIFGCIFSVFPVIFRGVWMSLVLRGTLRRNVKPIPTNPPQVPAQHCRQRSSWSTLLGRNLVGLPPWLICGYIWLYRFPGFPL